MAAARRKWQEAKARVKHPKDWEAKLRFKDDFGPKLDTLEKTASDLAAKFKALGTDLHKIESAAKRIRDVKQSIDRQINSSNSPLNSKDRGDLTKALSFALGNLHVAFDRQVDTLFCDAQMKVDELTGRMLEEFE